MHSAVEQLANPYLIAPIAGTVALGILYWSRHTFSRPNEPLLLPGGLPLIGHAFEYAKNSSELYLRIREFARDLQPISITLMGQRIYIVMKPQDISSVWRTKALDFNPVVEWGLTALFNMSPEGVRRLHFDAEDGMGSMYVNSHTFFRDHLAPGEPLNIITRSFVEYMMKDLETAKQEICRAPGETLQVDLMRWIRYRLGIPSTNAMAGEGVLQYDPGILDAVAKFDSDIVRLSSGLPKWINKDAHDNVRRLSDAFEHGMDVEKTLYWIQLRIKMMADRGVPFRDQTIIILILWQALQANAIPVTFWMIYQLLRDPKTLQELMQEARPSLDENGNLVDIGYLSTKTPKLNAFYWEALRYASASASVRKVLDTVSIGGRTLYKGAMVMLPARPYHMDPEIFGDDCDKFVADRFLRDGKEPGKLNPGFRSVRAFGGGISLCPGRHFAINEIFSAIVTIFNNFDISLVDPSQTVHPRTEGSAVSILPPNENVLVNIKLKGNKEPNEVDGLFLEPSIFSDYKTQTSVSDS
ncbi:SubName: Full=Related to cytochrome P450 7B1 {ECO:0000313/EMBL:CCA73843.1} [Serendipita indica DSM 11827]|uniref:Related to cytochrome P450 7B1 n=1 Tax=Serendipita indica (strain DSM 11827) TaxID=1109443 RepID=G4TRA0_SERID|nr:SubName: Full=Related to cytochrome P450 7B1 {ECO:0000313/EMBL:CCA73843.1} [Serendipita indica DSM 11827]CCA73843.1 related to cytochrome P450 7B1 [Serendipita indica DSM 11827]